MKTGPILRIRHTERNISQPIVVCAFPNKVRGEERRGEESINQIIFNLKTENYINSYVHCTIVHCTSIYIERKTCAI